MIASPALSDADLHGLVDGHLEADRRADALRRAAGSPVDRARIGAWQDQNDLIRAAFASVTLEPLPAILDLRTPPRLHCVSDLGPAPIPAAEPPSRRGGIMRAAATVLLVAAGLSASWWIAGEPSRAPVSIDAIRGAEGESLAARTAGALAGPMAADVGAIAPLPLATIPDLVPAGFAFTGAEGPRGMAPMLFRYRNADDERIVIGVARAGGAATEEPAHDGEAYVWRSGRLAFAIVGTVPEPRLRAIASSIRAEFRPE